MGVEEAEGTGSEMHGFSFAQMIDLSVGIIPDAPHEPSLETRHPLPDARARGTRLDQDHLRGEGGGSRPLRRQRSRV